jgi:hypothetical protein
MALTVEINHAKTRAKAAVAGQPVVPRARFFPQKTGSSNAETPPDRR